MEKKTRVGWYCPSCRYFEKAILRETTIGEIKKVRI
jgi:hypothetical protein